MIDWKLRELGYDKEKISSNGNKYLTGNGYMGVRGTLDEYSKDNLAAINLAGMYDQVGDSWREPVNAPNGFFGYISADGEVIKLPETQALEHEVELDYRHGILKRHTKWNTVRGNITVETERFVSMEQVHLGAERCIISADFHSDVNYVFGIDGDVWDINGPHFDTVIMNNNGIMSLNAVTHEKGMKVCVAETFQTDFPCGQVNHEGFKKCLKSINFITERGKTYTVERFFSVYTEQDTKKCSEKAEELAKKAVSAGFEALKEEHIAKWEQLWELSEVVIEGDDKAMEALNYSLYHLHCVAPRHTNSLSIAARGLSGQTYKGAVFWDTEMFIMDFFLMTEPEVARKLIKYRLDTLEGAKNKAKSYGYHGAFYAWESQEGGFDACSDYNVTDVFTGRPMRTYFKDKQVHISSAVVYGIGRYMDLTGDCSILSEGGAETIIECAIFYYQLLSKKLDSEVYDINDVIGPDEYHERVNNNGYTNRMAKYTFQQAIDILKMINGSNEGGTQGKIDNSIASKLNEKYDVEILLRKFTDAFEKIYIPKPNKEGIIPQFDGYFNLEDATLDEVRSRVINPKEYWGGAYGVAADTQIIKQADVVTWLTMFPEDATDDEKLKNWEYYEPRTEHGSSLSACMYTLLACKCGKVDKAYPLFMKSASADLVTGGKEWAGLVYIGGTHPASEGGAYMVAIKGFAGVSINGDDISVKPNLPEKWKKMTFNICHRKKIYKIEITKDSASITER
ncbi:MAG: glycoside hydrolase family 65 protein [Lachnospiraceae bacterium]|nr:glycoside hydrolase family 65 protein [Lachnospiraceae bacterium]